MRKPQVHNAADEVVETKPLALIQSIRILGRNTFQNKLVQSLLESQSIIDCPIHITDAWPEPAEAEDFPLTLYDCYTIASDDLWVKLSLGGGPDAQRRPVALFNLEPAPGTEFELQAIERGLRGLFYINDSPQRFVKGIESILNGELWFSRKTTSQLLMDPNRFRARNEALEAMLTPREREILIAIASGATNGDIADAFHISTHTVKTHIYNIYKKIDVHNRLEATLWVARYL